jgi:flagellar basal body-associated protein FliL
MTAGKNYYLAFVGRLLTGLGRYHLMMIAIEILIMLVTVAIVVLISWVFRDDDGSRSAPKWGSDPGPTPSSPDSYSVRLH